MSVFKRGKFYWFNFINSGQRYQRSTKQTDQRKAEAVERAFRTALANRTVGIIEPASIPTIQAIAPPSAEVGGPEFSLEVTGARFSADCVVRWNGADCETFCAGPEKLRVHMPAREIAAAGTFAVSVFNRALRVASEPQQFAVTRPTMRQFSQRFISAIEARSGGRPATVQFYSCKLARLLEFEPLATAPLDRVDEPMIEAYIQQRRQLPIGRKRRQRSIGTVNRELATLRRLLRIAYAWRLIDRTPKVQLLPGEHARDFVLRHHQQALYLGAAPSPLREVATLLLQTGMRVGEALAVEWPDVHLRPANGARFGYIHIRSGKSKNAKRNISLTSSAAALLSDLRDRALTRSVFANVAGTAPLSIFTLEDQHARTRALLKLPSDFVIHSLRHTMLTNLGEAGADAFTIMRIAGHSTVVVSQRYVHPSPESLERAFERFQRFEGKARKLLTSPAVTTKSTTADGLRLGMVS